MHRPLFKVIINNFLRFFQPFTKYKWVIISYMETLHNEKCIGYGFRKVYHMDKTEWDSLKFKKGGNIERKDSKNFTRGK